nr:flagellar protein FliT [Thioalkalivibrio sp. XN279]
MAAVGALDAAAAADAWDEALALEAYCRSLLEALLDLPPDVPMDLAQAEALEQVAAVYRRVVGMAEACRGAVAAELKSLRHGKQAAHAYGTEGGA